MTKGVPNLTDKILLDSEGSLLYDGVHVIFPESY